MILKEGDIMAYRNKFYVCFDSDNDIHYYWLMRAWEQDDGTKFNFYDAYDLNTTYNANFKEVVKSQLRARIQDKKAFVVLIGERTRYLQFVQWEIKEALALGLPIICVNLNGLRHRDLVRCPPIVSDRLSVHIDFNAVTLQHALDTWPEKHYSLGQLEDSSPYYYKQSDYLALGLGTSPQQSRFENRTDREDEFPKKTSLWRWHPRLRRTK